MGESRRKRSALALQRASVESAARQVGHALRRLAEAASAQLGADCYAHAELGRVLMADQGLIFQTRVGFAAWRVGPGDGDVLSHTPHTQGYLPPGVSQGFAHHAWLDNGEFIIDFTTYQFERKAQALDAADGGLTCVDWRPDFLVLTRSELKTYAQVAQAPGAGVAYYESSAALTATMAAGYQLDPDDVAAARFILKNPELRVMGPNTMATGG